ncbi:MAG: pilus assembly protein [Rhizobiaceae bacterium]
MLGLGRMLLLDFCRDKAGNYAIAVVTALVPLMGGMAMAVDYAGLNRERQAVLNALDAAGIATARHIVTGASEEAVLAYAKDFFEANLGPVDPGDTVLSVDLPSNEAGGGTLKLSATLDYKPYFFPVFQNLMNRESATSIRSGAETEIRLKNTLEVALVLDNSGSMDFTGSGSGEKRINLLKVAAKQLIDTLALQAAQIKQVEKPVQFGLVPFAASVNVGPEMSGEAWIDTAGISPVHHENFDWSTLTDPTRYAQKAGGVWYKRGEGWVADADTILSRFSLFKDMQQVDSREWVATGSEWICTRYRGNGTCRSGYWKETGYWDETIGSFASWQGCVESRPYPYNVTDTVPDAGLSELGSVYGDAATLFVPMFAPDEAGDRWATEEDSSPDSYSAPNNWWNDGTEAASAATRQANMAKYFEVRPYGATSSYGTGPNYSCTTNPITPLTDVSTETGITAVKDAIDAMQPSGATNVPEGLAWGWRVVSSGAPFTEGRDDSEKGNDKIVIVLTDGVNTYYTPGSLGYSDSASNKSTYSAYGYAGVGYDGGSTSRLMMGTSGLGLYDYSNSNYTAALNQQLTSVCAGAKAAGVIVMTVSLDLSTGDSGENQAIEALKACASDSRFRKDPNNPDLPAKLYWNATGGSLADTFREIGNELSNLRIVS